MTKQDQDPLLYKEKNGKRQNTDKAQEKVLPAPSQARPSSLSETVSGRPDMSRSAPLLMGPAATGVDIMPQQVGGRHTENICPCPTPLTTAGRSHRWKTDGTRTVL